MPGAWLPPWPAHLGIVIRSPCEGTFHRILLCPHCSSAELRCIWHILGKALCSHLWGRRGLFVFSNKNKSSQGWIWTFRRCNVWFIFKEECLKPTSVFTSLNSVKPHNGSPPPPRIVSQLQSTIDFASSCKGLKNFLATPHGAMSMFSFLWLRYILSI